MDWPITLAVAVGLLAAAVACGWLGSRPPDPHRGPRLLPYRFLMMLSAVGLILMVVHMLNLVGIKTGH